jgi:hypothetical protein
MLILGSLLNIWLRKMMTKQPILVMLRTLELLKPVFGSTQTLMESNCSTIQYILRYGARTHRYCYA